jgi:hypothetical protein
MRKTKTIKRMYSQSKIIVVLLFVGLIGMGVLSSCDKTKKFDKTMWVGELSDKYNGGGEITIFFTGNDKVYINARFDISTSTIDPILSPNWELNGRCSYKGKKMFIYIDDYYFLPTYVVSDVWRGAINGETMKMDNMFEETITFTKQ